MSQFDDTNLILSKLTRSIQTLSSILFSWVFWLAFVVTSCISYTFYHLVQNEDYLQREAEFKEQVEETHSKLLMQVNQYRNTLYEARSIYSALPESRKEQWARYIKNHKVLQTSSGHEGVALVEDVSGNDLSFFQQMHPNLEVTPKMQTRNCVVTMYSMSELYPQVLGYNFCATSTLEKALLKSVQSGKLTISPPSHLFGDTSGKASILFSLPVYNTDTIPETVVGREMNLAGWIVSPIQIEAFVKNITAQEPDLAFQLFQGKPVPQNLLVKHSDAKGTDPSTDLVASRTLEIDDVLYTLLYVKRDTGSYIKYSIPLLLLCTLFSLLGALLIWLLYHNRQLAETTAREMSQSLDHTEASIKKLLGTSPGAIYTHTNDQDWKTVFVSDHFCRLTGYSAFDFKNRKDFDQIIHSHDLHQARKEIAESLRENKFYEVEYRLTKKDGSIIWVVDKGYLEKNEKESFVRGVIFDITKTKRIKQASHQLNNALMYMPEGLSLVDHKGNFMETNPAFNRICGWGKGSMSGVQFMAMVHPEDVDEAERLFGALNQKEKVSGELRGLRQDGTSFYMSLVFVGLYDDDHVLTGAYLFVRDVSERKQAEGELPKAKKEISMAYKT